VKAQRNKGGAALMHAAFGKNAMRQGFSAILQENGEPRRVLIARQKAPHRRRILPGAYRHAVMETRA
jgi:hypothetical protein